MVPEFSTMRSTWEIVAAFSLWGMALLTILRRPRQASGRRETRPLKTIVRLLLATSLLILFLAPQRRRSVESPAPVAVVIDDSASMTRSLGDDDVHARAEAIAGVLDAACKRAERPLSISYLVGDDTFSCAMSSPLGNATRLANDVHDVFLLTDGLANPIAEFSTSDDSTTRIHSIVLGSSSSALNWRLSDVKASRSGNDASVTATIELIGDVGPRAAQLELWRQNAKGAPAIEWRETVDAPDDSRDGTRRLTFQRSWSLNSDAPTTWALLVVDQNDAANHTLEGMTQTATADERLSELCLADNATTFSLMRDVKKTRVLLVDDLPRYEYRYLRETLRREPTVELNTLLLAADPENARADPIAVDVDSLDRRKLSSYDVVIVGDLTHEQWQSALGGLVDVVERDGSTTSVWFAGAMRLGETLARRDFPESRLLPGKVVASSPSKENDAPRRIVPSRLASVVWPDLKLQNAPELTRVVHNVEPDSRTATLLFAQRQDDAKPEPLVLAASLGKNAVMWLSTDEMWRLQTLSDKSVYRSFVLQTLDYLTTPARRVGDGDPGFDDTTATSNAQAVDPFVYFDEDDASRRAASRELGNVAASVEEPGKIAEATKGQTLDLRNLTEEESRALARKFIDELNEKLDPITNDVQTPLIPVNLIYPITILLFILMIVL